MPIVTQYDMLLKDLEQLEKTMRERNPQPTVTLYDTETSGHPVGQCDSAGNNYRMAADATAA